MSKLRLRISMSLDGFVAGPSQSVENPLGIGGMRLHEWAFPLAAFREMHGLEGGEVDESTAVIKETFDRVGATIMGRNMFGGHPGPWNATNPWNGWWGANPPFHHPVFVLAHHPRDPLVLEGGTTFTFVTGAIEAALEEAQQAAGKDDVSLACGARAARQYLIVGLVDEMELSLVPILLGSGERLFEGVGDQLHGLELVRTVAAPKVTHLKFDRRPTRRSAKPRWLPADTPGAMRKAIEVFGEFTGIESACQRKRPLAAALGPLTRLFTKDRKILGLSRLNVVDAYLGERPRVVPG